MFGAVRLAPTFSLFLFMLDKIIELSTSAKCPETLASADQADHRHYVATECVAGVYILAEAHHPMATTSSSTQSKTDILNKK